MDNDPLLQITYQHELWHKILKQKKEERATYKRLKEFYQVQEPINENKIDKVNTDIEEVCKQIEEVEKMLNKIEIQMKKIKVDIDLAQINEELQFSVISFTKDDEEMKETIEEEKKLMTPEQIQEVYLEGMKVFIKDSENKKQEFDEKVAVKFVSSNKKLISRLTYELKKSLQSKNTFSDSVKDFQPTDMFKTIVNNTNRENPASMRKILRHILTLQNEDLKNKISGLNLQDPETFLPCFILLCTDETFQAGLNNKIEGFQSIEWTPDLLRKIMNGIRLLMRIKQGVWSMQKFSTLYAVKPQMNEYKPREIRRWTKFVSVTTNLEKAIKKSTQQQMYEIDFQSYQKEVFFIPFSKEIDEKILGSLGESYQDEVLLLPFFDYQVKSERREKIQKEKFTIFRIGEPNEDEVMSQKQIMSQEQNEKTTISAKVEEIVKQKKYELQNKNPTQQWSSEPQQKEKPEQTKQQSQYSKQPQQQWTYNEKHPQG